MMGQDVENSLLFKLQYLMHFHNLAHSAADVTLEAGSVEDLLETVAGMLVICTPSIIIFVPDITASCSLG